MATWSDDIYTAHEPELYRFALRTLKDHDLAEEFVQATFLKAWEAFPSQPDDLWVRPWLFRILKNRCIDYIRAHGRRHFEDITPHIPLLPDTASTENDVVLGETQASVRAAMEQLKPKYRKVMIQLYFLGMSCDAIAQAEGTNVPTVKSRLFQARKAFRKVYAA